MENKNYIEPRTSNLRMCVLSYNSVPDRQCNGDFDQSLQLFQPIIKPR